MFGVDAEAEVEPVSVSLMCDVKLAALLELLLDEKEPLLVLALERVGKAEIEVNAVILTLGEVLAVAVTDGEALGLPVPMGVPEWVALMDCVVVGDCDAVAEAEAALVAEEDLVMGLADTEGLPDTEMLPQLLADALLQ